MKRPAFPASCSLLLCLTLLLTTSAGLRAQFGPGDIDGNGGGIPTLTDLQQTEVTRIEEAAETSLKDLASARAALTAAIYSTRSDPAAVQAATDALAAAELQVALARANAYSRLQQSALRLSDSQRQELIAFRVRGGPPARGGGGFGARGGAGGGAAGRGGAN